MKNTNSCDTRYHVVDVGNEHVPATCNHSSCIGGLGQGKITTHTHKKKQYEEMKCRTALAGLT
jgi:hypothetical protein